MSAPLPSNAMTGSVTSCFSTPSASLCPGQNASSANRKATLRRWALKRPANCAGDETVRPCGPAIDIRARPSVPLPVPSRPRNVIAASGETPGRWNMKAIQRMTYSADALSPEQSTLSTSSRMSDQSPGLGSTDQPRQRLSLRSSRPSGSSTMPGYLRRRGLASQSSATLTSRRLPTAFTRSSSW